MKRASGWGVVVTLLLVAAAGHAERIPLSVPLDQRGFEQIAHRKGVTVYKHRESSIIRLGAEARFNATPGEVLRALLDYDRQVGTVDRLSEAHVLSRGDRSLVVYQRLNLPVISDRDFNLKVSWWKQGEVTHVVYRAVPRVGRPPRDGVVRVRHHHGSWQLKAVSGGQQTLARFQVEIDLAGWLPKWMARSSSGKEMPELFGSIDELVRKSRYRSESCTAKCL